MTASNLHLLLLPLLLPVLQAQHVVFEDVGRVATSISYLHVALPFNLTGLRTLIDDYHSALTFDQNFLFKFLDAKWSTDDFYDKHFDSRFVRKVVDPALQDFAESMAALQDRAGFFDEQLLNLTDLMPAVSTATPNSYDTEDNMRKKRFAMLLPLISRAVFGTIHGLYTKSKYDKLRGELNTVITQQNRLLTTSRNQEDAIQALRHEASELQLFFGNLTVFAPLRILTKLHNLELVIQRELDRMWDAAQEAQHHRLSIRFLPPKTLEKLFKRIKARAQLTGNVLLLDRPSDLFQIELSYCYDGSEITLILHVPMAPQATTLRLLKFLPFPFIFTKTHFLLPTPAKRLLAISSGEPRLSTELTEAELEGCYRVNNLYMCERQGVLKSKMSLTCLGALYDQQFSQATDLCQMKATPVTESVLQLNDNWFLVYAVKQFTAYITCRNSSSSEFHVAVGVNRIPVSPTCSVKLQDHVLHADTALKDVNDIIQFTFNVALSPDEVDDAEQILEELDDQDDRDPTLDSLRSMKRSHRVFPRRWWFYVIAAIVAAATLCAIAFAAVCAHRYLGMAYSVKRIADKIWPRRTHEDIYDIALEPLEHSDDEGHFEEIGVVRPPPPPPPQPRPRSNTLPRGFEPVDVLPPVQQPVLVRAASAAVHQVQVHRPVLRPRPQAAVEFVRSASRRLLRQRGGQPDDLPREFRRQRKPFH